MLEMPFSICFSVVTVLSSFFQILGIDGPCKVRHSALLCDTLHQCGRATVFEDILFGFN